MTFQPISHRNYTRLLWPAETEQYRDDPSPKQNVYKCTSQKGMLIGTHVIWHQCTAIHLCVHFIYKGLD